MFEDFRGIAKLSVMMKWYTSCLIELIDNSLPSTYRTGWERSAIASYRAGHSTTDITALLPELVNKAVGVRRDDKQSGMCIFEGDVEAAYDNLTVAAVERCFQY